MRALRAFNAHIEQPCSHGEGSRSFRASSIAARQLAARAGSRTGSLEIARLQVVIRARVRDRHYGARWVTRYQAAPVQLASTPLSSQADRSVSTCRAPCVARGESETATAVPVGDFHPLRVARLRGRIRGGAPVTPGIRYRSSRAQFTHR